MADPGAGKTEERKALPGAPRGLQPVLYGGNPEASGKEKLSARLCKQAEG